MSYIPPNANGQATMANSSPMVISSDQSALSVKSSVVQQAATNLTALNVAQTFTLQGEAQITIQLSGTWTATAIFEGSNDNFTNVTTLNAQRAGDNTITQTVVNSANNDSYRIGVAGFLYVRVRCSAYTSGTIVATSSTSMSTSTVVLSASLPIGANVVGKVSIDQTTLGTTNAVRSIAGTTGGATAYKLISAATTNATSVKGSAATLFGIQVYNLNAAIRYLKLYNKATAPTVGTDTPVKIIMIPGSTTGAGSNVPIPSVGVNFATGLAFALTTGIADTDTAAVAANEIVVNLDYN